MKIYSRLPINRSPTTPGEMLVEEFLKPLKMTQAQFAEKSGLGPRAVNEICRGKRAVTARSAILISDVFGMSAEFWLNCQTACDLWQALHEMGRLKEYDKQFEENEKELGLQDKKKTTAKKVTIAPKRVAKAKKPTRKKATDAMPAARTKKYA